MSGLAGGGEQGESRSLCSQEHHFPCDTMANANSKTLKGMKMTSTSTRPRAAAAVLRSHNHEILLVKHRWHDGTTSWILPGGALLPEEKPEEAALRELEEETGLKGKVLRFLFTLRYELGTSKE